LSIALWCIIVLAIGLRIFGAWFHPTDQDELYTVMESTDLFNTTLAPGIQSRPLYYLLQHALFWIMPAQEPWTRLISLVAGAYSIYLVNRLARRVMHPHAALVATIAVAFSPWHAYASETARYYAVIFALVTATVVQLIEARESDSARAWRLAALPVAIGVLVHPAYTLAVAALLPWALLRGSMSAPRWRLPSRAAIVGFVPIVAIGGSLLLLSLMLAHHPGGTGNGGPRSLAANLRLIPAIVEWATPALVLAGLLGLAVSIAQPATDASESVRARLALPFAREAAWMLGVCCVSTIALVGLASFVTATYADYAIGALPGLCIGAGLLAAWMSNGSRALALSVVLVGAMAPSLASHVIDGTRFDYRPAFDHARQTAPNQLVLTWPVSIGAHYAPDLRRAALDASVAELDATLKREASVWAVVSYKRFGIATTGGTALESWLTAHCREESSYERPRFDDREFRVSLQACRTSEYR